MMAGCALKAPPDTAAIKEQALPALQAPAQWAVAAPGVGAVVEGWLLAFNDDQLTAAVTEAIAHNADLRVGAARVEQALLHAKLAGAKLYPSVDLIARGGGKLSGDGSGLQGGVLTATWEVDLWGRVRYGRAASAAQAASAQADYAYARESIAALVAKSWILATEMGLQADAARETIRANEELVRLADERARIGVGNQADVYSARASVGTYRDLLRQLELGRSEAIRALELLLGRYPAAAAMTSPQLPSFPGAVPGGPPVRTARAAAGCDRRGASRGSGIQPDWRGQGGAAADHLPDDRAQRDHERAVPAQGSRQSGVECRRRPARADLPRRRAQDAGRDSHGRTETGDCGICGRSDCARSAKWKRRSRTSSPRAIARRSSRRRSPTINRR